MEAKNSHGYADRAIVRTKCMRGKIHMLVNALKMTDEEYRYFIGSYGVKSSTEMSNEQLQDAILKLEFEKKKRDKVEFEEMDHLRKMAIAAIGAWLNWRGVESNIIMIKAIACRAAKVGAGKNFNSICRQKLLRIYNRFKAMREAALEQPKYEAELRSERPYMEFDENAHRWQINKLTKKMFDKKI